MNTYQFLKGLYFEYLGHLQAGGARYVIPPTQRNPEGTDHMVYASSLGRCPLKNAYQRVGDNRQSWKGDNPYWTFPPNLNERGWLMHLMEQGTRDAEVLQEAVLWHHWFNNDPMGILSGEYHTAATVETSIYSHKYNLKGRMDILGVLDGRAYIVEIKRRDKKPGTPFPEPKLSDAYQVLSYHFMTGVENISILTENRYLFNVWTLRREGDGWKLYQESGEPYPASWNSPEFLNESSWLYQVQLQQWYLNKVKKEGFAGTPSSHIDFLSADEGWECFSWSSDARPKKYKTTYKGAEERTEFIKPRCPFWCHTDPRGAEQFEVRETEYDSKQYALVDALKPII